ncbi:MAG TPA: hypothetical protein VOB72_11760 [Candidatus Dormibacteraeota bacterium]|nr:hypothetical protein [Candidatus Dormibacteraeota bacterium]
MKRGGTGRRIAAPVLAVLIAPLLFACGQPTLTGGARPAAPPTPRPTPTPTPTAAEILTKPAASTMNDMHFTATVRATGGAQTVVLSGEGDMVARPYSAFHFLVRGTASGTAVSEEVITRNGTDYVRQAGSKFKASASTQTSDVSTWQTATQAALVGEEALPAGMAWHVKAVAKLGNPFEAWIRVSDGYLLRYLASSNTGKTTFDYSMTAFNTGVTIEAPPPNQVG